MFFSVLPVIPDSFLFLFLFFSFVAFIPCPSPILPYLFSYLVYKATDRKLKKENKKKQKRKIIIWIPASTANHNACLPFAATCRWKRPRVGRSLLPRANQGPRDVGLRVLLAGLFVHLCAGIVTLRYGTASLINRASRVRAIPE